MTPGKTAMLVTGDASRNKTMCVPGGGFVSVKIELPKNWDTLMKEAGYQPLRSYYLQSDLTPASRPQRSKNERQRRNKGAVPQH